MRLMIFAQIFVLGLLYAGLGYGLMRDPTLLGIAVFLVLGVAGVAYVAFVSRRTRSSLWALAYVFLGVIVIGGVVGGVLFDPLEPALWKDLPGG